MSNFLTQIAGLLNLAKTKTSPAAQDVIDKGEAFAKAVEVWTPELAVDGINALIDAVVPAAFQPEFKAILDFAAEKGFQFGETALDSLIAKSVPAPTVTTTITQTETPAAPT